MPILVWTEIFLFTVVSRPVLSLTHPAMQWIPRALSLWVICQSIIKIDHLFIIIIIIIIIIKICGFLLFHFLYVFMAWCLNGEELFMMILSLSRY
jgi:hypothetical protein